VKRSHLLILIMLFATAGCAVQPAAPDFLPEATPPGAETDQRTRARLHTELAAGYFQVGSVGVALEEVSIALRADSGYGPAYNMAGLIYAALKEDRLAEQNFRQALRIGPADSDAHHNFGWYLCSRGRKQEGIRHLLTAVRNPLYQFPDRSYATAGLCAREGGELDAADEYFQLALKARPTNPQALYHLADMSYARGDYPAARDYINRFTRAATAGPEVLWLGVRVERRLGDRNAEASFALQLRNNFPESQEARALLAGKYE
jgi:type IV pilus assembly protein PilF